MCTIPTWSFTTWLIPTQVIHHFCNIFFLHIFDILTSHLWYTNNFHPRTIPTRSIPIRINSHPIISHSSQLPHDRFPPESILNQLSSLIFFVFLRVKNFNTKKTHIKFILGRFKNLYTKGTNIKIVVFSVHKTIKDVKINFSN